VLDRDAKRSAVDAVLAARADRDLLRVSIEDLDRHALRDLLQGMVRHVFVRRGRGVPVEGRALVVWGDDLLTIDVPGPHRPGPFESIEW
jgi:hypothetical protein